MKCARHVPMSDYLHFLFLLFVPLFPWVIHMSHHMSLTHRPLRTILCKIHNSHTLPSDSPAPILLFYFAFLALTTTWQYIFSCLFIVCCPALECAIMKAGTLSILFTIIFLEQCFVYSRCLRNSYYVSKWMDVLFWRAVGEYASKHKMIHTFDLGNSAS